MRSLLGIVMVYLLAYTPDLEDASDPTPSGNGDPSHKDNSTKEAEKCTIVKYSKERYMEFHNKVRGSEGSSNMIELRWDEKLAKHAAKWVQKCNYKIPTHYVPKYLLQNHATFETEDQISEALGSWHAEKDNYITDGHKTGCVFPCRHYYTLVSWNIALFGCAVALCDTIDSNYTQFPDLGLFYLSCEYYAPSKVTGSTPNSKGDPCSNCPDSFKACRNYLCTNAVYPSWNESEIEEIDEELPECKIIDKASLKTASVRLLTVQILFLMMMMTSRPMFFS